MTQFHFDPDTYMDLMRAEVPAYDRLQEAVAVSTEGVAATRVLDLGTGTGVTLAAVLRLHPDARAVGHVVERSVESAELIATIKARAWSR